jgi:hypothetical protein
MKQPEWIFRCERSEGYIVDDAFFRRTFVLVEASSRIPETEILDSKTVSLHSEVKKTMADQPIGFFRGRHRSASQHFSRRNIPRSPRQLRRQLKPFQLQNGAVQIQTYIL